MRIALSFGLLNAAMPLLAAAAGGKPPIALALGACWVGLWGASLLCVEPLTGVLEHPVQRWVLAVVAAMATAATILATGGIQSPVANGANWLGWAATVVVPATTALGLSAVLAAGTTAAYLIDCGSIGSLFSVEHRYTAVTGLLNPPIIVLVALALAGVFRSVVAASPETLWRLRSRQQPASTPALSALLAGTDSKPQATPSARMPAPGPCAAAVEVLSTSAAPADALNDEERVIVDLLADGLVPKEVARELGRTTQQVYARIASAKQKVGARTIEHLIVLTWSPRG